MPTTLQKRRELDLNYEILALAWAELPDREKESVSLQDLAGIIGVSWQRIWQIENAALKKLKRHAAQLEISPEFLNPRIPE